MKITSIRRIPKYMVDKIKAYDTSVYPEQNGYVRFYAYMAKNCGELVKITVAVKNYYKKWYCKQVAVHGIHSHKCFVKDIRQTMMGGWSVGWYAEGLSQRQQWYEDGMWGWQYDRYLDPYAPILNIDYVLAMPEYKYSMVDKWLVNESRIFKYLRLYERYPQMEYLMKANLKCLTTSKLILKRTSTDMAFCKWLLKHKNEITDNCYIAAIIRAYKKGTSVEYEQRREKILVVNRTGQYKDFKQQFNGNFTELCDYVLKKETSIENYKDYFKACVALGLDMSIPKNRYPHDFMRWHDIRIDEYNSKKAELDAVKRKELYAKFGAVAEKYIRLQNCEDDGYCIFIAKSPAELMREGELLDHCVGRMGYDQKMVREQSLIFFVRHIAEPNKPFVTLEYSPTKKCVLQCYGHHDSKPNSEVSSFVNDVWLPFANKQLRKIQKAA